MKQVRLWEQWESEINYYKWAMDKQGLEAVEELEKVMLNNEEVLDSNLSILQKARILTAKRFYKTTHTRVATQRYDNANEIAFKHTLKSLEVLFGDKRRYFPDLVTFEREVDGFYYKVKTDLNGFHIQVIDRETDDEDDVVLDRYVGEGYYFRDNKIPYYVGTYMEQINSRLVENKYGEQACYHYKYVVSEEDKQDLLKELKDKFVDKGLISIVTSVYDTWSIRNYEGENGTSIIRLEFKAKWSHKSELDYGLQVARQVLQEWDYNEYYKEVVEQ
ncbi:hypothetical protein ACQUY5_16700 [Bacillus cereus]|uniref:hypothetical protein n=1 Tax=Bacillus cereus TaxID=1396 RepID=UPI003D16471F